jgi:hypothetical protein
MPLDPQRTLFLGMPMSAMAGRAHKFFDSYNVNELQLVAWYAETFVIDTQETTGFVLD